MTIREPTVADADVLGEIHVKAWQAAYRGRLMSNSYLEALSIEERAQMWREGLARHPRPEVTRLAVEDDGQLVGFTIVGPCEDEGAEDDALKCAGFTEAVLWVHPRNERARRFYESAGWRPDGPVRREQILGVETPEVRYRRSLEVSRRT